MPIAHSAAYHRTINATSATESPLELLEIDHPTFGAPVRVVNDTQDVVSNGDTFAACAFYCQWPDDADGRMPRARLVLDNVGRELAQLLEDSNGGEGATMRFVEVLRSAPDTIEREATLELKNVEIVNMQVTGELGYEDILNRPAVAISYRPDVAPGLF